MPTLKMMHDIVKEREGDSVPGQGLASGQGAGGSSSKGSRVPDPPQFRQSASQIFVLLKLQLPPSRSVVRRENQPKLNLTSSAWPFPVFTH